MRARKKTKKRYESIQRYALKNPEMIQVNIARVFRCNQATVSRALREFDGCGNINSV